MSLLKQITVLLLYVLMVIVDLGLLYYYTLLIASLRPGRHQTEGFSADKTCLPSRDMRRSMAPHMNELIATQENGYFPCFRCGMCCVVYQVSLSLGEARRIADELAVTWDEFKLRYLDDRWPGTDSFLVRQTSSGCVFLEREGPVLTSCRIHRFRPSSCRDWTPGTYRRECKEGLKLWGLHMSEEGEIKGPEETLARFRAFLQSLEQA